jgi:hypothetical protein
MNDHDLIARLAAANPVPSGASAQEPPPLRVPLRRTAVALAVAIAVGVPAAAFADQLEGVLGLSNSGTPVARDSLDLTRDTNLEEAMQELGFPSTLQLLGTRNGVSFYAARRPDGDYCFAIESPRGKGVGCDLNGTFPSAQQPVFVFPPARQLAGFAADGVATVAYLDAAGGTVASAPVSDNLFASTTPIPEGTVVSVEALDQHGDVISTRRLPGR